MSSRPEAELAKAAALQCCARLSAGAPRQATVSSREIALSEGKVFARCNAPRRRRMLTMTTLHTNRAYSAIGTGLTIVATVSASTFTFDVFTALNSELIKTSLRNGRAHCKHSRAFRSVVLKTIEQCSACRTGEGIDLAREFINQAMKSYSAKQLAGGRLNAMIQNRKVPSKLDKESQNT